MNENRNAQRTLASIEVTVSTVLDSGEGKITDLSETGAKIIYAGATPGHRVSFEAFGQDVFGTVAWSDADRFGMKFDQPLREGPLRDYLMQRLNPPARNTGYVAMRPRPVFGRKVACRQAA